MNQIYLDNAATTRVCPEATQAACLAMTEYFGNPSSTHRLGREARNLLENARKQVAAPLSCTPEELVFTASGSESDNWAILSGAEAQKRVGRHIISSRTEHDAVGKTLDVLEARGWEITRLEPEKNGAVSPAAVEAALREDTALVTLMLVNNETGAITDISHIAERMRAKGSRALLHTDAVQAFLKVSFSAKPLGADLISISGHKIHAPKGIGALYIRKGLRLQPFIHGGAQENGRRAGTESVPLIAAFGEAARLGQAEMPVATARMTALREQIIRQLSDAIPELVVIGGGAPHILSISLPGYKSEVLMNFLEARNIYVSKSSACKKGRRSHVLEAMKLPPAVIDGAIRIGLSRYTTQEEAEALTEALIQARSSLFTVLR